MKLWLVILFIGFYSSCLFCTTGDSVKVYTSKPVQVNGTSEAANGVAIQTTQNSTSTITFSKASTLLNTAFQISDALPYLPGVFVRNYGGLGGLKTVSVLGATPQQTIVRLDGVPLNNTQNGFFDITLLPNGVIDNIQLQNGGLSTVNGSGAVGGILDFSTAPIDSDTGSFLMSATYGSFAETNVHSKILQPIGSVLVKADAQYQHTNGNYPFLFNQFGDDVELIRTNADYTSFSGWIGLHHHTINQSTNVNIMGRKSERGAPGAVLQGNIENTVARLGESDLLCIVSNTLDVGNRYSLQTQASFKYNKQHYRDSLLIYRGPNGANDTYNAQDGMVTIALVKRIDEIVTNTQASLTFTSGVILSSLNGNLLTSNSGSSVTRNVYSMGVLATLRSLLTSSSYVSITSGVKHEWYSDVSNAFSPFVATVFGINSNVSIDAMCSYNYRAPSFNELYYQNYGTFSLKPERSLSYVVGSGYKLFDDSTTSVFNSIIVKPQLFLIETSDQIISVPKSAISWSAQNSAKVLSKGITCFLIGNILRNKLTCIASYTYQAVSDRDQKGLHYQKGMVYTPNQLGSMYISYRESNFQFGVGSQFTGTRFTQPDNAIESELPVNYPISTVMSYQTQYDSYQLLFRAEANNVLNQQYEVIRNFPMPGRILRLTVQVQM